jgi:hypothetical protein
MSNLIRFNEKTGQIACFFVYKISNKKSYQQYIVTNVDKYTKY